MRFRVELSEAALWQQFSLHQNEMIITKAGRCLFPLYRLRLEEDPEGSLEIDLESCYRVYLTIGRHDEHKWKWRHGRWTPLISSGLGRDDTQRPFVLYEMIQGSLLIQQQLNFDKLKLCNRTSSSSNSLISLNSFCHYIPVVTIDNIDDSDDTLRISLPETNFMAVTHYQNEQVTLLKKSYNPHAKGFVINEATPPSGTLTWLLTPERTSPIESEPSEQQIRKSRKRIRPVNLSDCCIGTADSIPLDEEELQGSIALQMLGTKESGAHP